MNLRVLVLLSLFVGIGFVLHYVVPPVFLGMKPDMALAMMFLGIILFPKLNKVLLLSLLTGIVSALTTSFPMGEIINFIEKPITAFIFLSLYLLVRNVSNKLVTATCLTAIGTLISGSIFLSLALYMMHIDIGVGFIAMFTANVLPAIILNTIVVGIIYPVTLGVFKRMNFSFTV
ncbi:MAG TPA: tryptophan transporter [Bacillota bacterium]|nr:tryptophan transporter [Bacillota bacterium]